jgi:hypothetical protein
VAGIEEVLVAQVEDLDIAGEVADDHRDRQAESGRERCEPTAVGEADQASCPA